ncbi:MAG: HlyD family efflux transporter periplasmic adaptor subunit [Bacteroidetes bacterium]|nr:HlyD family efflux transporter periplasmic adaptor subunit [Bacteroidota bacterium]
MKREKLIKVSVIVGIVVLGFTSMSLLGSADKKSSKREAVTSVRSVETQKVEFSNLALEIKGNGVIESQKTLKYISEANGKVLFAKNNLKDGTFVEKGEQIVEVDPTEVQNTLFSLRSDFLNAVASILPDLKVEDPEVYDKWYNYFTSININEDIPTLPQLSDSKEKIKVSTRNIFSKYYSVKNQEVLLSKHFISAPFSGYIQSRGIIENGFVSKGQELFTLIDAVNLEIAVPLNVEDAELINFSDRPLVRITNDKEEARDFTGRIVRRETNLDRNSQTLKAYVQFVNNSLDPYYLPGNYVDVFIQGTQLKDVTLLKRNLIDNDGYALTMVNGKLDRVKVDIVAMQGDEAVINNSIPMETRFVTTILQKPLIGMDIKSSNEAEANVEEVTKEVEDDSLVAN